MTEDQKSSRKIEKPHVWFCFLSFSLSICTNSCRFSTALLWDIRSYSIFLLITCLFYGRKLSFVHIYTCKYNFRVKFRLVERPKRERLAMVLVASNEFKAEEIGRKFDHTQLKKPLSRFPVNIYLRQSRFKWRAQGKRAKNIAPAKKLERKRQGGYSISVKPLQLQFVAITLVTFHTISDVKSLTGEFMRDIQVLVFRLGLFTTKLDE